MTWSRRQWFAASASLALGACARPREVSGGFAGVSDERGHLLRGTAGALPLASWPGAAETRRTQVLIAGGGVAGLAAARALRLRGIEDFALLELEDRVGGNSRGGMVEGIACPLGAHYLPVPGPDAVEVQELLQDLGLCRRVLGRWVYDERHLCHSPQERLYFNGAWQQDLLPLQGVGRATLAAYQRFAERIAQAQLRAKFAIPVSKAPLSEWQLALDAMTFADWLDREDLADPLLRGYLDYCCRDDYGAGIATVSAWAGIHYFASRHGFHVPGVAGEPNESAVLTWPEGNGWLTQRLAAPLGERLWSGRTVLHIAQTRDGIEAQAFNHERQQIERWHATHCIVALPVFVAARVLHDAPAFVREAAGRLRLAPWLVANLHLDGPLRERGGAPPSWDNVIHGSAGLGYVDAMHQSTRQWPGATVLTCYRALGDEPGGREHLLRTPWRDWLALIVAELSQPHPDLRERLTRMEITRYGHAMAMPVPGTMNQPWLRAGHDGHRTRLSEAMTTLAAGRLRFAHSEWSGYSIFEEAFTRGHEAATSLGL
jgi:monoamine oxidase